MSFPCSEGSLRNVILSEKSPLTMEEAEKDNLIMGGIRGEVSAVQEKRRKKATQESLAVWLSVKSFKQKSYWKYNCFFKKNPPTIVRRMD